MASAEAAAAHLEGIAPDWPHVPPPAIRGCSEVPGAGARREPVLLFVAGSGLPILLSALFVAPLYEYAGYAPWDSKEHAWPRRFSVPRIRRLAIWKAAFPPQTPVTALRMAGRLCGNPCSPVTRAWGNRWKARQFGDFGHPAILRRRDSLLCGDEGLIEIGNDVIGVPDATAAGDRMLGPSDMGLRDLRSFGVLDVPVAAFRCKQRQ